MNTIILIAGILVWIAIVVIQGYWIFKGVDWYNRRRINKIIRECIDSKLENRNNDK